jgi:DNA invertase Pin-like site-specific DNA recombinase/DNA-directed RNA polymerase subunit M/transcription elongation factor TFIIS
LAERQNMTIVGTYIDRALSARTDDRPEFQKMIRGSSKKQFEVVLVWKLDRFARNRFDSATYRAILKRNGVRVVSAKENISDGPEGIILESMLEGMAEYYSAELSVKVKRGQKENALKCKANGGMLPFGYKVNAERYYEIDPLTAPIVLEIFTRYADGQTVAEISEALNGRNVFANTKFKYTNKSSFHNLLKNRRYIGEYHYGDIIVPDGMPAIVPQDVFDAVQARMEKNRHKPAAAKADEEYILTTKLFCGKCGTMMVGTGGTSKTGKVHHYYKCGNVLYRKSCDKKTVKKDWIEREVVRLTREFVLRDEVIDRLADAVVELQKQENTTIPFLQKQINDVQKRIDNLLNGIEEGLMNASAKQRLDDLEMKKADFEISLAKEKIERTPLTKEQIVFWISKFKDGDIDDPKYRRDMVDIFVNSIFLYDDKIIIAFNYKDGTKTVSLAELESAAENGEAAGETANIVAFSGSHLDGCAPPAECQARAKNNLARTWLLFAENSAFSKIFSHERAQKRRKTARQQPLAHG